MLSFYWGGETMNRVQHKGSWGDRYIIEPRPNQNRITCSFCKHYINDGSCSVKPIVISEVGYNYWRHCNAFYLSDMLDTKENRIKVFKGKKIRSTYVQSQDNVILNNSIWEKELSLVKPKIQEKSIEIGSVVSVYEMADCIKEVFEIVEQDESDILTGKLGIETPVGKRLLNAKVGDICSIETPGGIINYRILKIK